MKKLTYDLPSIIFLYLTSIPVAGTLFSLVEGLPLETGYWWAVVTSFTIGYGDVYPVTLLGKVITLIFSLFWVFFIIPIVIANVIMKCIEDKEAFTHHEQEWQQHAIQTIATALGLKLPNPPKDY